MLPYHRLRMNIVAAARLARVLRALGFAGALAACGGSGLSSAQWAWCKEHLAQVDAAAAVIGLPVVDTTIQQPTWWQDYLTSTTNKSNALITANADFVAACNKAATDNEIGDTRVSWCLSDGIGPAWTASVALNLITSTPAKTNAYRAIPLEQRLDNAEFGQACQYAYAPPPPAAS